MQRSCCKWLQDISVQSYVCAATSPPQIVFVDPGRQMRSTIKLRASKQELSWICVRTLVRILIAQLEKEWAVRCWKALRSMRAHDLVFYDVVAVLVATGRPDTNATWLLTGLTVVAYAKSVCTLLMSFDKVPTPAASPLLLQPIPTTPLRQLLSRLRRYCSESPPHDLIRRRRSGVSMPSSGHLGSKLVHKNPMGAAKENLQKILWPRPGYMSRETMDNAYADTTNDRQPNQSNRLNTNRLTRVIRPKRQRYPKTKRYRAKRKQQIANGDEHKSRGRSNTRSVANAIVSSLPRLLRPLLLPILCLLYLLLHDCKILALLVSPALAVEVRALVLGRRRSLRRDSHPSGRAVADRNSGC